MTRQRQTLDLLPASDLSEWCGCYLDGWSGQIVPPAFAHPAKVSRSLVRRIYEHAFAEGWLRAGDIVVDPFAGISGTELDAMWNGCHWVGLELEPKFVMLSKANIGLWHLKYGSKPGFGSARILQGDSRKLSELIGRADVVCSSPPYAAIAAGAGGLNTKPGKNGQQSGRSPDSASQGADQRYGSSAGQLSAMAEGRFAAVVSSPPFERAVHGYNGIDGTKHAKPAGKNSQASSGGYGHLRG